MRYALTPVALLLAYAVWRWAPLLLDPLGLGEFLFVGRFCLIAAVLTAAETVFKKVPA